VVSKIVISFSFLLHFERRRICCSFGFEHWRRYEDPDATGEAYGEEYFKAAQEAKISEVSHLIARRKRDELIAPGGEERIAGNEGRADFLLGESRKGGVEVTFPTDVQDRELSVAGARHGLNYFGSGRSGRIIRIHQKGDRDGCGHQLDQEPSICHLACTP